jgi:multidrug efflux pump subunit AcrB
VAIARWRMLVAAAASLMLLATIAWFKIPRAQDPRVETNEVQATVVYPGASPNDIESRVIGVVERELQTLEGVQWIESTAVANAAVFHLRFVASVSMDAAVERVRGRIASHRSDLPAEVEEPRVERLTTAQIPQMVIAVTGARADDVLSRTARELRDELVSIPDIGGVDLRGAVDRAIRVRLDPDVLAAHGLTVDTVVSRLRQENVRVAAGELRTGARVTRLEVDHELRTAARVAGTPLVVPTSVGTRREGLVLGAVADVVDGSTRVVQHFLYGRLPAVGLAVRFRADANALNVAQRVQGVLDSFAQRLPAGVTIRIAHDQPAWVRASIDAFTESLLEGTLLVAAVVTIGLGWRSAAVVAGVLPLAVGGAVLGLFLLGFSLEQISITGLIVGLGLLVDDAIVVAESVHVMRNKGFSAVRAAILGTGRVFWANNATTAVACMSFLPLFFVGGDVGSFVRALPTAVILSLVGSIFVAQFFTPWVSTRWTRPRPGTPELDDDDAFDPDDDSEPDEPADRSPVARMRRAYAVVARGVVRHPVLVLVVAVASLVGAISRLPEVGFQFFPKADKPALFVRVRTAPGTPLEETTEKVSKVLDVITASADVVDTSTVIGGGYPPIFTGRIPPRNDPSTADVLVRTRDGRSAAVAGSLRTALAALPGIEAQIDELYHGPPVAHPITLRVAGSDLDVLRGYADQIEGQLRTMPGVVNVTDSLAEETELTRVLIDSSEAARRATSPAHIARTLRELHGEDRVVEFYEGGDRVDVVVQRIPRHRDAVDDLEGEHIPSASGATVPLDQVARVQRAFGPSLIGHRNGRRFVEVTADVSGELLPSAALKQLEAFLTSVEWKNGYAWSYGGAQEETEASFRYLGIAAAAALLGIWVLLLLVFDSFRSAAVVMAAVPFVLVGAILGLEVSGNPFSFMAFLGIIALLGVYVNHKIYFIDRLRELRARGLDLPSAVARAGQDRLRPVVLTALTAIGGLLPLTLTGGAMWSAFGWVNVFGLLASIPLSLVVLPAIAAIEERISFRLSQLWARTKRATAPNAGTLVPETAGSAELTERIVP